MKAKNEEDVPASELGDQPLAPKTCYHVWHYVNMGLQVCNALVVVGSNSVVLYISLQQP
jgi:hypothetical protein